jgi:hypothetical protein
MMKRLILLCALLGLLMQATAWGQERDPLAMRIEFEWTVVGVIGGAAVGVLLWLTDPANPSNNLADSVAGAAAWGAIVGAGFGVFVMQRNAVFPAGTARNDPLAPENRITSDPVAQQSGETRLLALAGADHHFLPGISVPLVKLRF